MKKVSAGLLMYKFVEDKLWVFLVHPGGPEWVKKDVGAWGIPKGQVEEGEEDLLVVAQREMKEETGIDALKVKKGEFFSLGEVKRSNGKQVHAWAFEGDWTGLLMGTSFVRMEYPSRSGKFIRFPEIDKADFFTLEKARIKIHVYQQEFLTRLEYHLRNSV